MVVYVDTKEIMRELGVETKLMGESGLYGRRCIKDLYGVGKNDVWRWQYNLPIRISLASKDSAFSQGHGTVF